MSLPVAAWRLARFAVVAVGDVPLLPQRDWCEISRCSVRRHPTEGIEGFHEGLLVLQTDKMDLARQFEGFAEMSHKKSVLVDSRQHCYKPSSSCSAPQRICVAQYQAFRGGAYLHIFNACHSDTVGCDGLVLTSVFPFYWRDLSSAKAPAVGSDCGS